jgi:hypothetical protein
MTASQLAMLKILESLFARSPYDGGKLLVHACIAGNGDDLRGKFVTDFGTREFSDFVISKQGTEIQDRVWVSELTFPERNRLIYAQEEITEILKKASPEVQTIISEYLTS